MRKQNLAEATGSSDEMVPVQSWSADAYILLTDAKDRRRYLYKQTMVDLLEQVSDGQTFSFKDNLTTTSALGGNEFQLAISWMRANQLCVKRGRGRYEIPSIENVRRKWNETIRQDAAI